MWDVADNARWVIRFLVDIEWDVIRLVIWHVFTTGQVERDIKEIDNFLVGFDRYFKAVLAKDVAQILFNLLSLSGRCLCYSEAVVSVQAEVVAMFLLNAVQEVIKAPTSSQDSAPSKLPMVTSKRSDVVFFPHGSPML